MPHRVAIIGQSNAILQHGYLTHLGRISGIEIGNIGRLGASPSVMVPLFASHGWLAGHDFCVIDTAVVDQLFLWAEAIDPWSIGEYLAHGIRMAHAAGCMPLLLVIPHRAALPDPARPFVRPFLQQLYRAVARHHAALLVDLTEPLDAIQRRSREELDAAYSDPNHLSEDFSRHAAGLVAEAMDRFAVLAPARQPRTVHVPHFERLPLRALAPQTAHAEYRSTVFGGDFVRLNPDTTLDLPTGAFDRLHGLVINRTRTDARLEIIGSARLVKALGTTSERDSPFVAQVAPILSPMRDRDGRLKLRIAAPDTPVGEPSWQPLPHAGTCAEISELLVQRGTGTLDYAAPLLEP